MKNIPNMLSACRIILLPFFVWQMFIGNALNAGIILAVSGITDFLDGKLARRFGWITDLGKMLDPVSDKLTTVTVSVSLALYMSEYWYFFTILILKDVIILALGGYLMKKGARLEGAKWFGKVTTFMFYAVMALILLFPSMPEPVVIALLSLSAACVLLSALLYIPDFLRYKRKI